MWGNEEVDIEVLVGKTITKIERGDYELRFFTSDGDEYVMHHHQECCETVRLEDVAGDLNDLEGAPILNAYMFTNSGSEDEYGEPYTWTFYNLATIKGSVTLRWLGTSNGYYSERVDFERVRRDN